jgi:hypothetical protein
VTKKQRDAIKARMQQRAQVQIPEVGLMVTRGGIRRHAASVKRKEETTVKKAEEAETIKQANITKMPAALLKHVEVKREFVKESNQMFIEHVAPSMTLIEARRNMPFPASKSNPLGKLQTRDKIKLGLPVEPRRGIKKRGRPRLSKPTEEMFKRAKTKEEFDKLRRQLRRHQLCDLRTQRSGSTH